MKVLVTGSSGLIGSALCTALRKKGVTVVEMDIRNVLDQETFGDILDYRQVAHKVLQVDGVVHLAAVSRVILGERNPNLCWKTNVEGTKHVLEAALDSPLKPWVLYASSREVYGQQKDQFVKETASLRPVNIYGESKVAAEKAVEEAMKKGLKAGVLRFSNVFGSVNDHPDRVIPAFCAAAARGLPIRIDGEDTLFDFTCIDDVVQGIVTYIDLLSKSLISLPSIHLTTGRATSLRSAASYAQEASSHQIELLEAPSRSFDVATFSGDPTRASTLLNWKASIDVRSGIHRLVDQFKTVYGG